MPQSYTVGGDTMQEVNNEKRAGQTFRPELSYSLLWVDIELNKTPAIPEPVIRIFLAGADHKPFGDALSQSKWMERWGRGVLGTRRVRFPMTPLNLSAGQYYCIVVTFYPPLGVGPLSWQYDTGDATYIRGKRISSDDHGATWTVHDDDDHIFTVFGNPPAPPPPPEPPVENWAILDIQQILTETGYRIIVTTNTPCHLYMEWTPTEPEKHPQTKIERGLAVPAATKYCFVVFTENEQAEPGDTIYHTFIKEPWAECETRWFCFRAKVDNEWSPSISPIFTKHRTLAGHGPAQTITFYSDAHPETTSMDGRAMRSIAGQTWAQIRDGEATHVSDTDIHLHVTLGRGAWLDTYQHLSRSALLFDTSVIPLGSLILAAELGLLGESKWQNYAWPCAFGVYRSFPTSNTGMVLGDYNRFYDTPLAPLIAFADWASIGWNKYILNADGLAVITPGGITKLGMREGLHDAPDIPMPGVGWRSMIMDFFSTDRGHPDRPYLKVTFMPLL